MMIHTENEQEADTFRLLLKLAECGLDFYWPNEIECLEKRKAVRQMIGECSATLLTQLGQAMGDYD